jgi:hypothetical protein
VGIAVWAAALGMVNLAFAAAGVLMFRRNLNDTLGFAIGGIVLGSVGVAVGLSRPGYWHNSLRISGIVLGGLLALVGRSRYRRWATTSSSKEPASG